MMMMIEEKLDFFAFLDLFGTRAECLSCTAKDRFKQAEDTPQDCTLNFPKTRLVELFHWPKIYQAHVGWDFLTRKAHVAK